LPGAQSLKQQSVCVAQSQPCQSWRAEQEREKLNDDEKKLEEKPEEDKEKEPAEEPAEKRRRIHRSKRGARRRG
jgi:hypothetical protein